MHKLGFAILCLLTSLTSGAHAGGTGSSSGYGYDIDDYDFGFSVPTTPFPDGHGHSVFRIYCDDLKSGMNIAAESGPFDDADHRHKVKITVEQQMEIRRGNAVVVQTNDIHPHNWKIRAGQC